MKLSVWFATFSLPTAQSIQIINKKILWKDWNRVLINHFSLNQIRYLKNIFLFYFEMFIKNLMRFFYNFIIFTSFFSDLLVLTIIF
jgi:hypothetical protein